MPSKTSKPTDSATGGNNGGSFVDNYLADWGDDNPFRSPSPEPARNTKETEKKKDVLGIDQQLDLKRKPRAPRVKLDDARLLSDKGIPKLRKRGPRLRFKGKGHEFDDAGRLLSFYQEWLDDLFPKANFLDALAMVEKAGHKTTMRNARMQWIDEGKPRAAAEENDEDNRIYQGASGPQQPDKVAAIFENTATAARERAKTPTMDDLFGDDDIYNATPLRNTASTAPSRQAVDNDIPDDDDLDALIAEAETGPGARTQQSVPSQSIFGNGSGSMQSGPTGEPDDDELDALMAEAEANTAPARPSQPMGGSIFGDGKAKQPVTSGADEEDDLDALMAEAETASVERPQKEGSKATSGGADTGQLASFEDDEEAMAEMDGLW